jgi:hypothetical protein
MNISWDKKMIHHQEHQAHQGHQELQVRVVRMGLGAKGTDPALLRAGQGGRQALRRMNAPVRAALLWAHGAESSLLSLVEAHRAAWWSWCLGGEIFHLCTEAS